MHNKSFKPKAHILRLLGNELIKNPTMAIYELIKNSYDADSTYVNVTFESIDDISQALISVEDNGTGLTTEIIETIWLEPGTDHRKPIDKNGNRIIKRSPIFRRVPMGEKGVGRFAVHKLGDNIELITRPKNVILDKNHKVIKEELLDYEITLKIDWNIFSQKQYLDDILISWNEEKDPSKFYFKNSSGTKIKITGLKEPWSKRMAKDLKRNTLAMLSPKNNPDTFKINLDFKNNWLENFKDVNEILEIAPYKFNALLDENYNLTVNYEFNLALENEFGKREIQEDTYNIQGLLLPEIRAELKDEDFTEEEIEKKMEQFLTTKNPFGSLFLEIYSYDLDSDTLKKYTEEAQTLKAILKNHSGIKVFKNEMRVYDYGEPGNDWLKLDIRRIQNKDWFSNNQNIGYIHLDAEQSTSLIEKTSREGFIDNNDFKIFYKCVIQILTDFKAERLKDRNKWLTYLKSDSNPSPVDNQYNLFTSLIDNTDFSEEEQKKKLKKEAEKLQQDYEEKKETMLIPAGVGMTASVALHEIEKVVPQMEKVVQDEPFKKDLAIEKVEELKDYLEGILSVLRKGGNKPIKVKEVLEKAISNYKFKLSNRKIIIESIYDNNIETIKCDKRYFITMIMNMIDNSIYWLDTTYNNEKYILIKTIKEEDNTVSIIIADNGPGFKDEIKDIVRPFFSRKEDGIGIGLYLVDTIMMKYGKLEIINIKENNKYSISSKYTGAVLKLSFKRNQ